MSGRAHSLPLPARSGGAEPGLLSLIDAESDRFVAGHPRSVALAEQAKTVWRGGTPMHWMGDWASPTPIFAARGEGARLIDVDGLTYDDFCLGDTASMFGHGRPEVAEALARQAGQGASFMLPTELALEVGGRLAERFGLPLWQATATATDANRAALRWARAVTGRPRILVFDGAYHGAVDDTFVDLSSGRSAARRGLVGQVQDVAAYARVVPFNDLPALQAALAHGDVAAVLAEPAMTNCGMILPRPGFHEAMRRLTREAGTLLIIDETHTLSTGPGGYTRAFGLEPDILTLGKAVAGGLAAAVWGMTAEMAERMDAAETRIGPGYSGIGTTLSGSALALAGMQAMLSRVMTQDAYDHMLAGAARLVAGLSEVAARWSRPWTPVHLGARVELVFAAPAPQDARAMRGAQDPDLLQALHLYLINRGVLIAPFHNMMLVSPATSDAQVDRLVAAVDGFGGALEGIAA